MQFGSRRRLSFKDFFMYLNFATFPFLLTNQTEKEGIIIVRAAAADRGWASCQAWCPSESPSMWPGRWEESPSDHPTKGELVFGRWCLGSLSIIQPFFLSNPTIFTQPTSPPFGCELKPLSGARKVAEARVFEGLGRGVSCWLMWSGTD